MKKVFLVIIALLNLSCVFATNKIYPSKCSIEYKVASSKHKNYFSCLQSLNCDWEFYWEKTPEEVQNLLKQNKMPDSFIKVPSYWNKTVEQITREKITYGSGTYRIIIKNLIPNESYGLFMSESPATSAAIYANGELIFTCGDPYNQSNKKSHSIIKPVYAYFTANQEGLAEIQIYVTNYFYRIGGLWSTVQIGPNDEIFDYYNLLAGINLLTLGIMVFICLLNLLQFFLNPKQRQYIYLAVITFACATRVLVAGFNSLGVFIPGLPAEIKIKIEFLAIWVIPTTYYILLVYLYPGTLNKIFGRKITFAYTHAYLTFSVIFGLLSIFAPASFSNRLVPYLQLLAIIGSSSGLFIILVSLFTRKKYVVYHLLGILFLTASFAFDIVFVNNKEVLKISYVPIFFALYSIILLTMLSNIQNDLFLESEDLADDLQNTNLSYIRFVPLEFLSLLKKDSITNIKLGDHTSIEMAILFSKISVFDKKNSRIPDANLQYEIYSEYLKSISPFISRHSGFISKFLSGGVMALFPGVSTADDALYAAMKMVECLKKINEKYNPQGLEINVFTGIHYGYMILGTIGDENRLDDTVISDTVNTVSRIETICEQLNQNVIVSEDLFRLTAPGTEDVVTIKELKPIPIKGKEKPLKLLACKAVNEVYEEPTIDILFDEDEFESLEEVE